jgi:hypothetical protein
MLDPGDCKVVGEVGEMEAERESDVEDELAERVAFRGFLGRVEIGGQCIISA